MNEQEKVQAIYRLIGERGLYVNTNYDIFTEEPETVTLAGGAGFEIKLASIGWRDTPPPSQHDIVVDCYEKNLN